MAKAKAVELVGRERVAALELQDRIARARAKIPKQDPTGEHHERLANHARLIGRDVVELLDLWDERAAARQYDGCADRATAEREAADEVVTMFPPAQGVLL